MNGADSLRERQFPDLDSLDVQSLKALVLAKQAEIDSRTVEIEHLKLLVLKLKRMHFGPRSEKCDHDIKQLELRLEPGGQPSRRRARTAPARDCRCETACPAQARTASVTR